MGAVRANRAVAVFREPGVLNVRVIFYNVGCFANETGIRGEELIKILRDTIKLGGDFIVNVFMLNMIDSDGKNYQQQHN